MPPTRRRSTRWSPRHLTHRSNRVSFSCTLTSPTFCVGIYVPVNLSRKNKKKKRSELSSDIFVFFYLFPTKCSFHLHLYHVHAQTQDHRIHRGILRCFASASKSFEETNNRRRIYYSHLSSMKVTRNVRTRRTKKGGKREREV